jgi:hypothetical protein
MHPRNKITIGVDGKIGMHPAQGTDLSYPPLNGKMYLCLNCRLIIAVCPFITRTPAKATEAAEILTDIGHMQILIFYVSDSIAHMAFPHLICSRSNLKDFPACCAKEPRCLCLGKAMSTEYI